MKQYLYITILAILFFFGTLSAETVSQKEASKVASLFFDAMHQEVTAPPKLEWTGRQLTTNRLFVPFYVYNSPKGGYVIVSADNKAYPILAYSRSGRFESDKITEAMRRQLKRYASEIEIVRYDSRVPQRAIDSWQNLPLYISRVIGNPYATPEFTRLSDDEKDAIEELDRLTSSIYMPGAVEYVVYNPYSADSITLEDILEETDEEYVPFSFYEEFIAEIERERVAARAALEESLMPTEVIFENLGGAHYQIKAPAEIEMMSLYGMDGQRYITRRNVGSQTLGVDMSSLPAGFYVCMVLTADKKISATKIAR